MHFFKAIVSATLFTAASCTTVLVPLYIWPGDPNDPVTSKNWDPLVETVKAHSGVEFWFIINPSDGPTPSPDVTYTAGLSKFTGLTNVNYLGYVWTGRPEKLPASTIKADIDEWAGWPAPYRPKGIFFDDADRGETPGAWDILREVSAYAETKSLGTKIVNNMGTRPTNNTGYELGADQTIIYENSFANYGASEREIDAITAPGDELSILIYSMPVSNFASYIQKFVGRSYGSLFFTNGPNWNEFGSELEQFVAAFDAAT